MSHDFAGRAQARPAGGAPSRAARIRTLGTLALVAMVAACKGDPVKPADFFPDEAPPRVALSRDLEAQTDTTLNFKVDARDNVGLKSVAIRATGGVTSAFDTTFTAPISQAEITVRILVPRSAVLGSTVRIKAVARDGRDLPSDTAQLILTVGNVAPPQVTILSPATGTEIVRGKSLVLSFSARSRLKIRTVGYVATTTLAAGATGTAFAARDSIIFASPLRDSVAFLDTLVVPESAPEGSLSIVPFVTDSLNTRVEGLPTAVGIRNASQLATIPQVRFGANARIEVTDTIGVEASDPVGISVIGYEVRTLTGAIITADSATSSGTFSSLLRTFRTRLPISVFPTQVTVHGFARNANGRRGVATLAVGGPDRRDTVTVVAGSTRELPQGGQVADGLYFPRTDRLYLTNIERNWIEVFNLADSTFREPIQVGSRPWGIATWPRDRNGVPGDTLLIANSGGTNVSYVNLNSGPTGREVYRYALPNIIAYSVTSVNSATVSGGVLTQRTVYDFSDRPQYLGATCNGGTAPGSPCGDVILTYSTTPTPGQTAPFPNKGTLRWENLTRQTSHFFFEHAVGQTAARSDTLEIERFAARDEFGRLVGSDSVLVPYGIPMQDETGRPLFATPDRRLLHFVVFRIDDLAFRDTTFVRNSGNFRRAVFGEGGSVTGSRAMTYDATPGLDFGFVFRGRQFGLDTRVYDKGISRPIDVRDFIANANAKVNGVGVNFDGELNAIRGDSTYLINSDLRLQGLLQTRSGVGGFDFHPFNQGVNSPGLNTRLSFAASSEPLLEIYDTFCFRRVGAIPIRDPIIGPLRVSIRAGGQIVLAGVTRRGVVIVTLPNSFSNTCS
ncbi:MAG: hypothetical protein MUF00_10435 [Gemmatimonadaceae bacterium]|nr:hypothetical protein [Gemmatimonadaceae bacterium]